MHLQFSLGFIRFYSETSGLTHENPSFTPLIYRLANFRFESMPQEPMSFFGWLMNCCVSDERSVASREMLSTAVVFVSGMAASGLTLYFAGLFHLI